jgi:hypothetical protein
LREDANAEEDARRALGDRVLVELVQNAVDSTAAGPAGACVRIEVVDGALRVLDRGPGLTADGLASLCSLRASSKSFGVGMFGTGFTAVLALTDAPEVHGPSGSVGFSATRTLAELGLGGGHVPVLRLPFDVEPRLVPEGWSTMVHLPLRAGVTVPFVERALPLLMPGLARIEQDDVVIEAVPTDGGLLCDGVVWDLVERAVVLSAEAVWSLPVERRGRSAPVAVGRRRSSACSTPPNPRTHHCPCRC